MQECNKLVPRDSCRAGDRQTNWIKFILFVCSSPSATRTQEMQLLLLLALVLLKLLLVLVLLQRSATMIMVVLAAAAASHHPKLRLLLPIHIIILLVSFLGSAVIGSNAAITARTRRRGGSGSATYSSATTTSSSSFVAPSRSSIGYTALTTTSPQKQNREREVQESQYLNHRRTNKGTRSSSHQKNILAAAPRGALPDIVIPSIFHLSDWTNNNSNIENNNNEDPRVWVPQTPSLSFRPLCFCTSQGYYVNLLKFIGGGTLGRHRHSSPVHALTLTGSWKYREHEWHAHPGTYVFEPPGETHTLIVDSDCTEMVALFHVTGSLLYVDERTDELIGYDDVFTKLEKARSWYEECGLGAEYADQFIR
jgi:2,4'-dihydroxyacetophenone dioxygenase